jgi:hypothetical protein
MKDQASRIVLLREQVKQWQYSLETLGGAERLAQRGRIADAERQLRALLTPAESAAQD